MTKVTKEISSEKICEVIVEGMQENKAEDIVIMDLREVENAITDFFVIASGNSTTQVDAIAEKVMRNTRKKINEKPWHQEGKRNSQWVILDYVSVVAHIFYKDVRSFYELEDLWADAKTRQVEYQK